MKLFGLNSPEIFLITVIILSFLGTKRIEKGYLLFQNLLKFLLSTDNDINTKKVKEEERRAEEERIALEKAKEEEERRAEEERIALDKAKAKEERKALRKAKAEEKRREEEERIALEKAKEEEQIIEADINTETPKEVN